MCVVVITGLQGVVLLDAPAAQLLANLIAHCRSAGMNPNARLTDVEMQLRKACASVSDSARDTRVNVSKVGTQSDSRHTALYDLVDSAEAATILGCKPANVRDLARRGRLPRHRAGRGWVYPAASVVALAEKRAARRD